MKIRNSLGASLSRPGFVLDVDRSTPPIVFARGDQFTTERLPVGSRAVYAPEPTAPIEQPDAAIREALEAPLDGDPLRARLKEGMRLTIAFDTISTPVPRMSKPDSRQRVIEAVLDLAASAHIDDVVLIAARGLSRRMTEDELRHILGDRIYDAFVPHGALVQHDAEAPEIAEDPKALNKRIGESDLVVVVETKTVADESPHQHISENLTSIAAVRSINSPAISRSEKLERQKALTSELFDANKIFSVQVCLNNNVFAPQLSFLQKREWEWSIAERAKFRALQEATIFAPNSLNRRIAQRQIGAYGIAGVFAGNPVSAHGAAARLVSQQQAVTVEGQSDIVSLGVSSLSPYSTNSLMNPVLMASTALGTLLNMHTGTPVVRSGGAAIIHHPTQRVFDTARHPSYVDFFDDVLAVTSDAIRLHAEFEDKYGADGWYTNLYRSSYAFSGIHPFHTWYKTASMLEHLGGVIVVGGDPHTVRRLGFKPASTFEDALEMARDVTGNPDPSLTHLHMPPMFTADVR